MSKEEFIKQRCEIDKITLEEFNRKYKVVEIRSQNMIGFDISKNKSVYTSVDIKKFMERNNNIQVISRESFRKELDRIIELLQEGK